MAQRSHCGLEEADHVWMTDYCSPSISDHRLFSPHVHQPLSKPPADSRRKRVSEGRKEGRRVEAPAATIEEDQEDQEEDEDESYSDEEDGRATCTR